MTTQHDVEEHAPGGRVVEHSSEADTNKIAQEITARVEHFAQHPAGIDQRLEELDKEWDVERTLETNASTLVLAGLALSEFVDRRWLILSGVVAGFLLQHGIQGWCPPLFVLRRMGFRTCREIEWERVALKAVRGDFAELSDIQDSRERARAALKLAGD
ncbi:hypothetical protein GGR28_001205 [Lewinella aquimaris]|uniref:DUF2892 domain-containing protein n=1 Tax=Neolewinella aquimaris TaxID=1835722 RepID=A0A840E4C2_9BACT|nr:DUF2892 domain-containing protein [Neolewinella aquimaris]MBB4078592.1 hypothetical protein [Neolewinella aquimaris]